MAFVGLRRAVFAPITDEPEGSEPVYAKGVVVGHMIKADLTFNRDNSPLHGDDMAVEVDNSVTGGTVSINTDDISENAEEAMLGAKKNEDGEYMQTGASTPYGGFGYMRVRRLKGVTSYVAYWLYKTQFAQSTENASTKAQSIEWQTPTLDGQMMGVSITGYDDPVYRASKSFTKESEAVAWINAKAGITGL